MRTKSDATNNKKLSLRREQVRNLTFRELGQVRGGDGPVAGNPGPATDPGVTRTVPNVPSAVC
jgi:hypothetical protein